MTSASPRRMISKDSPMECADAVHAVHTARLGPRAPKRIDTWPAARLMMDAGMKNGEIRRGPPFRSSGGSGPMVETPPIPDGKLRRREGVFDEEVDFLDVLLAHELQRIEALDLAGDTRRELRGVEMGNGANAALASAERAPVGFGPDADRGNQADAGDDHSPAQGSSYFFLACASMYSMASFTRVIFSASLSAISMRNSSSKAMTSSPVSSESAPRSSTNDASGVTSSSSTPNCSTMI